MPKQNKSAELEVYKVDHGQISFCVLGTSPLILNRMSQKSMREILMPKGRKTATEKKTTLKHDPLEEFRQSAYTDSSKDSATLLQHLSSAFKGAIKSAALDMAGVTKAEVSRLTWVDGERVSIYGVPKLFMAVTRSAGIDRTPDVRTRMILPTWAAYVTVSYVMPNLREQSVSNLLASAGIMQGVGDWRPGKGAGTYGQFILVGEDDPEFQHLVTHCGRAAQEAAVLNPEPHDYETRDMLEWFDVEAKNRGFQVVSNG